MVSYYGMTRMLDDKDANVYCSENNDFIVSNIKTNEMWIWACEEKCAGKIEDYILSLFNSIDLRDVSNIIASNNVTNAIIAYLNESSNCLYEHQMGMIAYYCNRLEYTFDSQQH